MPGTLVESVVSWLAAQNIPVFLVGGCVRDQVRGVVSHDLDLAVDGDALSLARRLANRFGGAFYALDESRNTGRALLRGGGRQELIVDAARFRGPDLLTDLQARDFTMNALAADVRAPARIIDPLGGRRDIERRLIRPVSGSSIADDPLRALRAVRQATELGFELAERTRELIRRDGHALGDVANERVRDELARLFTLADSSPALKLLDQLGLLTLVFPELGPMRHLRQPPPHHLDAFDHSLETVRCLERFLVELPPRSLDAERTNAAATPRTGSSVDTLRLGPLMPLGPQVKGHLGIDMGGGRPRLVSLKLAALLHDVGKPGAKSVDGGGRIRFFGHEQDSAAIASATVRRLRFTNSEVRLVRIIVKHHMRPILLAQQQNVSRRAVYRFFRDTGQAGIDVLLHSLADHLATYQPGQLEGGWGKLVDLAVRMLGDYWEGRELRVEPPALVDGRDIMRELELRPGPEIGRLLELVREAQVSGEVRSREEALALARRSVAT